MKSARRTAWGVSALLLVLPAFASAATITVTGTGDANAVDGVVTLREAITSANNNANLNADVVAVGVYGSPDTINFAIPGAGVHTIQPTMALPTITEAVIINGFSQPGSSANTLAVGNDSVHLIEIDGTIAGIGTNGLTLVAGGGGSTIQGLVINRFQQDGSANNGHGIFLSGSSGNTISGNFIGTNAAGNAASVNQGSGVLLLGGSTNNTIGGTTPAARNVLSGNSDNGILLGNVTTLGNIVRGNYIGTNAAGTAAIANTFGIQISSSGTNTIGGAIAGARNVISGNTQLGIEITNNGASNNVVQGNYIGTDATGALSVPNGSNGGVRIRDGASGGANDNRIGGNGPGEGNVIAFNTGDGVNITAGSGFFNTGNSILGNSIFSNGDLGIDLGNDGVTTNDTDDPDVGHNGLQNFPVISSVMTGGGSTTIQGILNSTPSRNFLIEFFSSPSCDTSGNGEGQTFLQSTTVATDSNGDHVLNYVLGSNVTVGHAITATATDQGPAGLKSKSRPIAPRSVQGEPAPGGPTSEFSACFIVGGATPTPTNTPLKVTSTPTSTPSNTPTVTPSNTPTTTFTPTSGPSPTPTLTPSNTPTLTPSNTPTTTLTPTSGPSPTPTLTPSNTPTLTPSNTPTTTFTPTSGPSPTPTLTPTFTPTATPTNTPPVLTATPTATATAVPPSATPTVIGGGGGPAPGEIPVPTLSEGMLALLALALAGVGFYLSRRTP